MLISLNLTYRHLKGEKRSVEALGFGTTGVEVFVAPVAAAELSAASQPQTVLKLPGGRAFEAFFELQMVIQNISLNCYSKS